MQLLSPSSYRTTEINGTQKESLLMDNAAQHISYEFVQAEIHLKSLVNFELFKRIPYEELKKRLDQLREAHKFLHRDYISFPVVHIAGTKGKGSTCAMLESILMNSGKKVGHFSSPHLHSICERVRVNAVPCCENEFGVEYLEFQRRLDEWMNAKKSSGYPVEPFTFFEVMTLFAFDFYAKKKVDIAILEVGLGGTYDATNICSPLITIITSISFDHIAQLGPSLANIASEKAGIIKKEIPCVSGVLRGEAKDVIREVCLNKSAPLFELEKDFFCRSKFDKHENTPVWMCDFQSNSERLSKEPILISSLKHIIPGEHQSRNAALAIASAVLLRQQGWSISEKAIRTAFEDCVLPVRIEKLHSSPTLIVDGAHNAASIEALIDTLAASFPAKNKYLLFGTTLEKDTEGMLSLLIPFFNKTVFTSYSSSPRRFPAQGLAAIAESIFPPDNDCECITDSGTYVLCGKFEVIPDAIEAFEHCWNLLGDNDLLCVTGSFYLAAEIRSHFIKCSKGCAHQSDLQETACP